MSQWTHVVGSITCSWTKEEAIEKLGKPVLWDDHRVFKYGTPEYEDYMKNIWEKAFDDSEKGVGIPMGSEGSIEWYFVEAPINEHTLGEGSMVAIEGDLRDFGGEADIQIIINWFKKAVKDARFATLTIRDEYKDEYITLVHEWGTWNEIRYPTGEEGEGEE